MNFTVTSLGGLAPIPFARWAVLFFLALSPMGGVVRGGDNAGLREDRRPGSSGAEREAGGTPKGREAQEALATAPDVAARELIRDRQFQRGFRLIDPRPGRRIPYGRLAGPDAAVEPVWDLDQWSSRFPLTAEAPAIPEVGRRRWGNAGKAVTIQARGTGSMDLALAVHAIAEYDHRARQGGEPWVHLLVEQGFEDPPSLAALRSARLRIEARLVHSEMQRTADYSPGLHAAQFQLFLMIQNRNPRSVGHGKLVWFGVPLFDDRSAFPREHKQQDTGGTSMFIFTPGGEVFSDRSAHDGEWIRVDRELVPLLREALVTAWQRGFLAESRDWADYRVTGMNLGWEVPGLFDVEMQVRDLSLRVEAASPSDRAGAR